MTEEKYGEATRLKEEIMAYENAVYKLERIGLQKSAQPETRGRFLSPFLRLINSKDQNGNPDKAHAIIFGGIDGYGEQLPVTQELLDLLTNYHKEKLKKLRQELKEL